MTYLHFSGDLLWINTEFRPTWEGKHKLERVEIKGGGVGTKYLSPHQITPLDLSLPGLSLGLT